MGKKAQWAGDSAMKSQPRKFGIVYPDTIDISAFVTAFAKYGGKLATKPLEYTSNGSTVGDPATAEEQAPTIISALKAAGVTSVIMFTDVSMGGSMTKVATQQEYRPEWVTTGYNYQNLALLARTSYDQDQWAHTFGLNTLWPCALPNCTTGSPTAIEWYYGVGQGTTSLSAMSPVGWLATGIQYAGPTLNAKNFKLGQFAVPARGGAASNQPIDAQSGYGKTAGLAYDVYAPLSVDFVPSWYDARGTGISELFPTSGQGANWYLGNAQRYIAGEWPKKPFTFFSKSGAVQSFPTSPVPIGPVVPCTGCPSQGGSGQPSSV